MMVRARTTAIGALAALTLAACAPTTYAGIPLRAGAADFELQQLTRRAMSGDSEAQLELGIRYEEGRGVPRSLARAERLFLSASSDRGGRRFAYSARDPRGNQPASVPVDQGPRLAGIPEARQRWIAVRSKRRAEQSAAASPQEVANEAYLAERLASDRQLGAAHAASIAVQNVVGPRRVTVDLRRIDDPQVGGELCRAVESLVRRYRDYGFESCNTWMYSAGHDQAQNRSGSFFVVDYSDRYPETEEYRSFSGHITYRAPFSPEPGTFSYERLSGEFTVFDLLLQSGQTYRVLIGPVPPDRRRSRRAAARQLGS